MEGREFCNESGCAGQGDTFESAMESSVTNHIAKEGPLDMPIAVLGKVQNDENELLNSDSHQHLETESRHNTCIKIKKFCSCPPQGLLAVGVTNVIMVALIWGVVWSITGSECLPGGNLFGILALLLCAVIGGKLVGLIRISKLPPLPPLLGMLLAGFLIRNIPVVTDQVKINFKWSAALRNIALAIILTRAGLGLDPKALKKLKAVCLRLSFGPCAIETCCAAVLSHLLMGLPLTWGFMLGFVLGAVSPAVVVPSMLLLQKEGYGVDKGIPTLLMAAGSFDDILAITGFNTCFGMAFSSGSTLNTIIRGVLEVVIGIAAGLLLGFFLHYFPSKDQTVVEDIVAVGWDIFQPLLFSLIGSEIQIASLRPETVALCIATLGIALIVRICFTFLMVSWAGFQLKEKIFISLAWMPKATVQAAIGSVALDMARSIGNQEFEGYGMDVLTVAFLAILITAPIGALIIGLTGPRMLQKLEITSTNLEETTEAEIGIEISSKL
ncbi:sodium/hydrogen exchanger 9B2-like isoform X2 [Aquarana catesbeiana]|uniref:sodium/hydrogen exchanger 9B2-like isoform X2 n=1 Tax=Aquarana catesbeiana TaxID=8400 RepID=UPI003CCA5E01